MRAYTVWGVGVFAFVIMVMQRTTLGVSGLDATQRFAVTPTSLSLFAFVQVLAYVLVQIPAGVLVDRFGSRAMAVLSCLIAACGQLLIAVSSQLATAIGARVVVGVGDALILMAVLALIPRWFAPRLVPVITQLTVIVGQVGQILSAIPFLSLLHARGWTVAFASAAAMSALAALVVWAAVRNAAPGAAAENPAAVPLRAMAGQVRVVWRRPGTKLGFCAHTATQFPVMVFCLLWGYPYLVSAQGVGPAVASGMLTVLVLCSAVVAPVMGILAARYPGRRTWLLVGSALATITVWTVLVALPEPAPMWLLYVLIGVLSLGSPASVVALDIARTANPSANVAAAQSIVNVGGFTATLVVLVTMGLVLDHFGGFTLDAFRIAWLAQYPFWVFGLVGMAVYGRRVRRIRAAPPQTVPSAECSTAARG